MLAMHRQYCGLRLLLHEGGVNTVFDSLILCITADRDSDVAYFVPCTVYRAVCIAIHRSTGVSRYTGLQVIRSGSTHCYAGTFRVERRIPGQRVIVLNFQQ